MTRNKRTSISDDRCPVGRTLECFSLLHPITRTPEEAGMTPEQMVTWEYPVASGSTGVQNARGFGTEASSTSFM